MQMSVSSCILFYFLTYVGWGVAYEAVKMTPVFTLNPPKN